MEPVDAMGLDVKRVYGKEIKTEAIPTSESCIRGFIFICYLLYCLVSVIQEIRGVTRSNCNQLCE